MKFNLAVIDPPGARYTHFLFDGVRLVQYGLESLGHACVVSRNNLDPGCLNVIFGGHQLDDPEVVRAVVASKVRYVVQQSELIQDGQVNSFGDVHWTQCYLPLLRGAVRVWEWSTQTIAELGRLGVAADLLELGYHPRLRDIQHKAERDIDVLWYGSVTPHRAQLLDQIAARGVSVATLFDEVAFFRNDCIARAKLVLTLQQHARAHVAYARILYAVNNHCLVAGESPAAPHWSEALYEGAPAAGVADLIAELLARDDRDALVERHLEAARRRPMTASLEPILDHLA